MKNFIAHFLKENHLPTFFHAINYQENFPVKQNKAKISYESVSDYMQLRFIHSMKKSENFPDQFL